MSINKSILDFTENYLGIYVSIMTIFRRHFLMNMVFKEVLEIKTETESLPVLQIYHDRKPFQKINGEKVPCEGKLSLQEAITCLTL